MAALCVLCARGGSKGVPRKNLMRIAGRPLLAYTIDAARATPSIERVVLSTDDAEIAALGRSLGAEVPFMRPPALAGDTISKWPVLRYVLEQLDSREGYQPPVVVDLDPTSPLRYVDDIERSIALLQSGGFDLVITAFESERNPYFNMVELEGGMARLSKQPRGPVTARQMAPKVYSMNASVYVYWRRTIFEHSSLWDCRVGMVEMPRDRSIDIDDEIDRVLVEQLLLRRSS